MFFSLNIDNISSLYQKISHKIEKYKSNPDFINKRNKIRLSKNLTINDIPEHLVVEDSELKSNKKQSRFEDEDSTNMDSFGKPIYSRIIPLKPSGLK